MQLREVRPFAKWMPKLELEPRSVKRKHSALSRSLLPRSIPEEVEMGHGAHAGLGSQRARTRRIIQYMEKLRPREGKRRVCQSHTAELPSEASALNPSIRGSVM